MTGEGSENRQPKERWSGYALHKGSRWLAVSGLACLLLVAVLMPVQAGSGPVQTLPRRTPLPPATPAVPSPANGGAAREPGPAEIRLQVSVDSVAQLGNLWTGVQWQDASGGWHDVEGWQGQLDGYEGTTAVKTWHVAAKDFGRGPFRWLIRSGPGGELLAASVPFLLPKTSFARLDLTAIPYGEHR